MRIYGLKVSLGGIWASLISGTMTLLLGILSVATYTLFSDTRGQHLYSRIWAGVILFSSGVRVRVSGLEHLPQDTGYVLMANHTSHFDILAVFKALPVFVRFVAKIELFSVPIFGRAMEAQKHIRIDRRNRESALQSLKEAGRRIRGGIPVLAFPEGTRYSNPGEMGPFKKGPFHLAKGVEAPVVPIWIEGASKVSPAGALVVRPGRIYVHVCEPIYPDELENLTVDELMVLVRSRLEEAAALYVPQRVGAA